MFAAYEEKLRTSSAVDFDDLLVHVVTILKRQSQTFARIWTAATVMSWSTSIRTQTSLSTPSSGHSPLTIPIFASPETPTNRSTVGAGRTLSNILEFESDYPGCQVVKLEQNYRSTKNILSVADHLIRFNRNRKPKSLLTENPRGAPVELTIYARETDEAEGIAGKIASLVREGELPVLRHRGLLPDDGAHTSRRAGLPSCQGSLSDRGRAFILRAAGSQGHPVIPESDGESQGRPGLRPSRQRAAAGYWQDVARPSGRRPREQRNIPLLAMARLAGQVDGLKDKAARTLLEFSRLIDELTALVDHPAEEVIRQLLDLTGYRAFLGGDSRDNGEDRLANLDELISAAREFDQEHPGAAIQDFLAEVTLASPIDRWDQETGAVP